MFFYGLNSKNMEARAIYRGETVIYCSKCDEYYPAEDFHKQNSNRGYSSYCKTCTSEVNRKYREERKVKA